MFLTPRAAGLMTLGFVIALVYPALHAWWWILGCVIFMLVDALLAPSPRVLEISRAPHLAVRLGQTLEAPLVVQNRGKRRVTGWLRDAWPPSAGATPERQHMKIKGEERARFITAFTPTRRGDHIAGAITIRTLGPLRLAGRQRSFVAWPSRLRALHPFPAQRHLPSKLAVLRQLDGRAAMRTRGQGTEFDSLRDYVSGDDVRSIDWRATARRRDLVVRTWQPEQHRPILIVIDTSRTSAARIGDSPRLDAAMDAALLLASLAAHARDRVHIIAGDRRIVERIAGRDRADLLHRAMNGLTPIQASLVEADWRVIISEIMRSSTHRGLVVFLSALESSALEEGLMPLLPSVTARHQVVLASVADPELDAMAANRTDIAAVYDSAAAERTRILRGLTAAGLRTLGADVLDAPPAELPSLLADHYLALKRRGLL